MGDAFFGNFKELRLTPLWVLAGLAIASGLALYCPSIRSNLTPDSISWLYLAGPLFAVLTVTKFISVLMTLIQSKKTQASTVSFSPLQGQCHWNFATQPDGRNFTQVSIGLLATNLTDKPIGLSSPKLFSTPIGLGSKTEYLDVIIESPSGREFGTTAVSKHRLVPNLPQQIVINGILPKKPWFRRSGCISLKVELSDTHGDRHQIAVELTHV